MSDTDFLLGDDRDLVPTAAEDDYEMASGALVVAQDLAESLHTPLGSLPWDAAAGSRVPDSLNAAGEPGWLVDEARSVALRDGRIRVSTLDVRRPPEGGVAVTFDAFGQTVELTL